MGIVYSRIANDGSAVCASRPNAMAAKASAATIESVLNHEERQMAYTDRQLAELRQDLERRRTQLVDEIRDELSRSDEQRYVDLAGQVADAGEASVADLLVDVDNAMAARDIRELREIEAAL